MREIERILFKHSLSMKREDELDMFINEYEFCIDKAAAFEDIEKGKWKKELRELAENKK